MARGSRRLANVGVVVALASCWILANAAFDDHPSSAAREPRRKAFNVRGAEELELNCPTLAAAFPVGTIRCEACKAVAGEIATRVRSWHLAVEDVVEHVCEDVMSLYELRQRTNGMRYWARWRDRYRRRSDDDDSDDEDVSQHLRLLRDDMPLSFHNKAERETLPCASHTLKRYCEGLLGDLENVGAGLEAFLDQEKRSVFAKCFGDLMRSTKASKSSSAKVDTAKRNNDAEEFATTLEATEACLVREMCESKTGGSRVLNDCHSAAVASAWEKERVLFLKYEGAYGNDKVNYVAEEHSSTLLRRNPYAPRGDKERANEFLNDPDRDDL